MKQRGFFTVNVLILLSWTGQSAVLNWVYIWRALSSSPQSSQLCQAVLSKLKIPICCPVLEPNPSTDWTWNVGSKSAPPFQRNTSREEHNDLQDKKKKKEKGKKSVWGQRWITHKNTPTLTPGFCTHICEHTGQNSLCFLPSTAGSMKPRSHPSEDAFTVTK